MRRKALVSRPCLTAGFSSAPSGLLTRLFLYDMIQRFVRQVQKEGPMRHPRKMVITTMILSSVLILVGLAALAVGASEPPPQHSHTLIQNMSSESASVQVDFYNSDGSIAHSVSFTLAGNGGRTIHTSDYAQLGASWRGSQVVSSDQPIVASVVNYGYSAAHSIYEGLDDAIGATTLFMPSIHWNAGGQVSDVAIQNLDSADAEVEITYYNRAGTIVAGPFTATIKPGAAEFRNGLDDCSACGSPPVGSMRVTSTNSKKIAAAVQENVHDGIYGYVAFNPAYGDTKFLLPSVHHQPAGQFSHVLVQNMSDSLSTNATITYYQQDGTVADVFTHTIAAKGSWTFHTTSEVPDEEPTHLGNVGSAIVTSDGPDILVTAVETVLGRPYSYRGFNSTAGSMTLLLPSVHHQPAGQFSHILVQNTSSTTSTDVTIYYYNQDGTLADSFTRTLAPNGAYTFHTTNQVPAEEPTNLGNVGSAVVTSDTTNVVAIVVETIHMVPAAYEAFEQ